MNDTDNRIERIMTVVAIIAVIIAIIIAITTGQPLISECNVNTPC